jgi:hypothetical protein
MISFLFSHIVQQNIDALASNYRLNLPPSWLVHVANMCCTLYGGEMLKAI